MTLHNDTKNELYFCLKDLEMDKYEYSKEWDKCTYGLYLDSCRQCLFENLCRLEKWKDIHKTDDSTTEDWQKNM